MSSQRGNVSKKGPPKHQNKTGWKNVYHDTSKKSKQIATTEVSGVCKRCKDVIDWKIKYKKYKVLTQPKTCVTCKQKAVKNSYHIFCLPCAGKANKCAKCGESKDIVTQPSLSAAEQASEERQLEFELELLPERKRRTFLRLQEQGKLTNEALMKLEAGQDDDDDDEEFDSDYSDNDDDEDNIDTTRGKAVCDSSNVNNVRDETEHKLGNTNINMEGQDDLNSGQSKDHVEEKVENTASQVPGSTCKGNDGLGLSELSVADKKET